MSAKAIEQVLDGPAGYAVAIAAVVIGVLVLVEFAKSQVPNVINPLNNLDANLGLTGFDDFVSGLFQPPAQ